MDQSAPPAGATASSSWQGAAQSAPPKGAQCAPDPVSQSAPSSGAQGESQSTPVEKRQRGERGGHNRPSKASWKAHKYHGIWIKRDPGEGHLKPEERTMKVPMDVVNKLEGCQYYAGPDEERPPPPQPPPAGRSPGPAARRRPPAHNLPSRGAGGGGESPPPPPWGEGRLSAGGRRGGRAGAAAGWRLRRRRPSPLVPILATGQTFVQQADNWCAWKAMLDTTVSEQAREQELYYAYLVDCILYDGLIHMPYTYVYRTLTTG